MSDSESSTAAPEKEKSAIRGVFSTQEIRKVGTGTTTRKTVQKTFWFVEQAGDVLECQPLNPNFVPSGPKRKITMDELIAKFSPEPEFYQMSVYPKMRELQQSVRQGDAHREKGETFSAEYEYSRALKVDEENVRANFGIGLTYLERGEKEKAQNIFERIVKLEGTYEPQQKHLFNEFGINLRKNRIKGHWSLQNRMKIYTPILPGHFLKLEIMMVAWNISSRLSNLPQSMKFHSSS